MSPEEKEKLIPGKSMILDIKLHDVFLVNYFVATPSCPCICVTGWRSGKKYIEAEDLLGDNFELITENS